MKVLVFLIEKKVDFWNFVCFISLNRSGVTQLTSRADCTFYNMCVLRLWAPAILSFSLNTVCPVWNHSGPSSSCPHVVGPDGDLACVSHNNLSASSKGSSGANDRLATVTMIPLLLRSLYRFTKDNHVPCSPALTLFYKPDFSYHVPLVPQKCVIWEKH